jgi:succinate dehydrogenase/fumarate reductase-like Fe-S protein
MAEATLRVFRGDGNGGEMQDYRVPVAPGMVVLDALHSIQAHQAPDLAVRWNCKAGKCGSRTCGGWPTSPRSTACAPAAMARPTCRR